MLNGETTSLKDVQVCCSNQDAPDFMLHAVSTGGVMLIY
jgi:RNA exonuclease 1